MSPRHRAGTSLGAPSTRSKRGLRYLGNREGQGPRSATPTYAAHFSRFPSNNRAVANTTASSASPAAASTGNAASGLQTAAVPRSRAFSKWLSASRRAATRRLRAPLPPAGPPPGGVELLSKPLGRRPMTGGNQHRVNASQLQLQQVREQMVVANPQTRGPHRARLRTRRRPRAPARNCAPSRPCPSEVIGERPTPPAPAPRCATRARAPAAAGVPALPRPARRYPATVRSLPERLGYASNAPDRHAAPARSSPSAGRPPTPRSTPSSSAMPPSESVIPEAPSSSFISSTEKRRSKNLLKDGSAPPAKPKRSRRPSRGSSRVAKTTRRPAGSVSQKLLEPRRKTWPRFKLVEIIDHEHGLYPRAIRDRRGVHRPAPPPPRKLESRSDTLLNHVCRSRERMDHRQPKPLRIPLTPPDRHPRQSILEARRLHP